MPRLAVPGRQVAAQHPSVGGLRVVKATGPGFYRPDPSVRRECRDCGGAFNPDHGRRVLCEHCRVSKVKTSASAPSAPTPPEPAPKPTQAELLDQVEAIDPQAAVLATRQGSEEPCDVGVDQILHASRFVLEESGLSAAKLTWIHQGHRVSLVIE
ncbi:MAG: hypothetical protein ACYDAY_11555 [Candidatus Dormibacteria bacterium]